MNNPGSAPGLDWYLILIHQLGIKSYARLVACGCTSFWFDKHQNGSKAKLQ